MRAPGEGHIRTATMHMRTRATCTCKRGRRRRARRALEGGRGLRVRKLEAGHGDEDFGGREDHICEHVPRNRRPAARGDRVLDAKGNGEGEGGEGEADAHLAQRRHTHDASDEAVQSGVREPNDGRRSAPPAAAAIAIAISVASIRAEASTSTAAAAAGAGASTALGEGPRQR